MLVVLICVALNQYLEKWRSNNLNLVKIPPNQEIPLMGETHKPWKTVFYPRLGGPWNSCRKGVRKTGLLVSTQGNSVSRCEISTNMASNEDKMELEANDLVLVAMLLKTNCLGEWEHGEPASFRLSVSLCALACLLLWRVTYLGSMWWYLIPC